MKPSTHGTGRVSAIGPCDVLLGRGTGPNENQGNKMFRDILRKYKEAYRVAQTNRDKRDVIATAIEEFKTGGGRFVERVVLPSYESSSKHCYEIVDGSAVSLKARQAFRYLLRRVDETTDGHQKERNTSSEPKAFPSQRRLPTIDASAEASFETSLVSTRAVFPSQVENLRSGELTQKDVMAISRLASLVSDTPMLASLGTNSSSYYCPTTSPWRQQELIPLSFLPLRQVSDDISASKPDMLLNPTANANPQTIPGLLTNEITRHHGQNPTMSEVSRAKLIDTFFENWRSPTTTATDALISSQYWNLSAQPRQQEESRIMEQRAVVARALIEHRLRENRLAEIVAADLRRIMMMDKQEASPSSNLFRRDVLEKSHQRGSTTGRDQIKRGPAVGNNDALFPK